MTTTTTIRAALTALHQLGANVTAVAAGEKRPTHQWKQWENNRQPVEAVQSIKLRNRGEWVNGAYYPAIETVGVIAGINSWRVIDLDAIKLEDGSKRPVPPAVFAGLLDALGLPPDYEWSGRSKSGAGCHIWLTVAGDLPPEYDAARGTGDDKGVITFDPLPEHQDSFDHIELRWERCQTALPAPTGYNGQLPSDPPAAIELDALVQALAGIATPRAKPAKERTQSRRTDDGDTPLDRYARAATDDTILDLLEAIGWREVGRDTAGRIFVLRDGSDAETSGNILNGRLQVHTTADPRLPDGSHSAAGVYAHIEHGGDFRAAAKALAEHYGMSRKARGDQTAGKPAKTRAKKAESTDSEKEDKLPPQVERLLSLANERCTFFREAGGDLHARIPINGHTEVAPIAEKGSRFRSWLIRVFLEAYGHVPTDEALSNAIRAIRATHGWDAPIEPVYTRIGAHNGAIVIDMGDDAHRAIEVTADGWRIIEQPPVNFRRSKTIVPLPEPQRNAPPLRNTLRPLLNVSTDRDYLLIVAFLLACFMPPGAGGRPILALSGPAGAGKTTMTRLLRGVTDPNSAAERSLPRNEEDLAIACQRNALLSFENISYVPPWLSDALCRVSTGGALGKRTLYSDDEETVLSFRRPAILNGITDYADRGDLLDRMLPVTLDPITPDQRRTAADVEAQIAKAGPAITGALLDAVSAALRTVHTVSLSSMPRLADVARWSEAAAAHLGYAPGTFVNAITDARADSASVAIEAEPLAQRILEYCETTTFAGTATELLDRLNSRFYSERRPPRRWPKAANALSTKLKQLSGDLALAGVTVKIERDKRGSKIMLAAAGGAPGDDGDDPGDDPAKKIVTPFTASQSPGDDGDDLDGSQHQFSESDVFADEADGDPAPVERIDNSPPAIDLDYCRKALAAGDMRAIKTHCAMRRVDVDAVLAQLSEVQIAD